MIRSSHWMFRYPGMTHAGDLRFNVPVLERDARAELRERMGVGRLPEGTEFWKGFN